MTDWNLIRRLTNSAIDAFELADCCGVSEGDRCVTFKTEEGVEFASAGDYLQSAWTYPENLSSTIVRARQELHQSKPYTDELARALENIGRLFGELVGAEDVQTKVSGVDLHNTAVKLSIEELIVQLIDWYSGPFSQGIQKIKGSSRPDLALFVETRMKSSGMD